FGESLGGYRRDRAHVDNQLALGEAGGDAVFAKRIEAIGCDYLDAPVSGGEVGAKAASLTIMVGGKEKAFERARPLLEKMGKNITHVGGSGD
ncbi:NAD(P)-binding domain-containing protein, partial [Rhizobium ruizarguesonis]